MAPAVTDASAVLEEVVVTATRRPTEWQQVPASLSIVPAGAVRDLRMVTIDDVAGQVPDLAISAVGNTTPWVFLRGVGSNDINANAAGAVGIYQDDVYMNSTAAQLQQMYDLERVEVLKGPQGALYGRNTTGGVINLISMKPQPVDSFLGRLSYGWNNQLDAEVAGNVAIGEHWLARVAAVRHSRDPLFDNTNGTGDGTDTDNWAARGMLRYRQQEHDWILTLYGSQVDAKAAEYDKSLIAAHPVRADVGEPRSEPLSWPGYEKVDIRGATLAGTMRFPTSELTSITSVMNSRRDSRLDLDSSAPDWIDQTRRNDATQYSQEFRLASHREGGLQWLVGAWYFRENLDAQVLLKANQALGVPSLTFVSDTQYSQQDTAWAAFVDLTWKLDRLSLLAGGRFTDEKKHFRTSQQGYFNAPLATSDQQDSWSRPAGSLGLSYALDPRLTVYGRYSHGFRAGGFNAGGGVDDPAFGPEYVDMFEAGMKATLADRRLRLDLTLFAGDYRDMQVYALVATPDGPTTQYLTNAAKAGIRGVEAGASWRATGRLQIDVTGAWLDARFDRYVDGTNVDRSGNRLAGAPETTLSGVIRYEIPLRSGARITATVDGSYRDGFYFDSANTARYAADARSLLGARIGYTAPGGRYSLALWGRNLTDETFFTRATTFLVLDSIAVGEPRTYGVEIGVRL